VNEAVKNKKLTDPCHMTQVNQSSSFSKLLLCVCSSYRYLTLSFCYSSLLVQYIQPGYTDKHDSLVLFCLYHYRMHVV